MKLNIKELAREAGAEPVYVGRSVTGGFVFDFKDELEAFARLIVERCAQECAKERNTWADYSYGYSALVDFEQRLRNLMEDLK